MSSPCQLRLGIVLRYLSLSSYTLSSSSSKLPSTTSYANIPLSSKPPLLSLLQALLFSGLQWQLQHQTSILELLCSVYMSGSRTVQLQRKEDPIGPYLFQKQLHGKMVQESLLLGSEYWSLSHSDLG